MLSIATVLFGITALWGSKPLTWFRQWWWLLGLVWLGMYALSWLWTDDKANWGIRMQVKLTLLILPLAFAYLPKFNPRQVAWLTGGMGLLFLCGACYSLSFFITDYDFYIREYHISHILPVPAHGDYIRCSTSIAIYMVWSFNAWPQLASKTLRWAVGFMLIFLGVFLNVLAAKSGLLSLYLFLGLWAIYYAISSRKLAGLIILVALPFIFTLAVKKIPTLHERKEHVMYTIWMYMHHDKSGNVGDLSRIMSYPLALDIIKQYPLLGVGAGDMQAEMNKAYEQKLPQVPTENRLLPHNQFMVVALACGIPAAIVFILWVIFPLFSIRRNRESFYFFTVWLILMVQLLIEPVLEVHLGVFVYLFFILLIWHALPPKIKNLNLS
jgi:uncharacterized membrane protein